MKLLAYTRVSSASQEDNTSLQDQKNKIAGYCHLYGHDLVEVFTEVGSGKSANRKQYQMMLERLPEVDGIIALKLDRLTRSPKDLLTLLEEVLKPNKKELILMDLNMDTSSPLGLMMVTVMAAVAQLERATIRQRTEDGKKAVKAAGGHVGGGELKYGYSYDKESKSFQPVPEEQEAISLMFELRMAGLTQQKIAQELNSRGYIARMGVPFNHQNISRVMKREQHRFPKPEKARKPEKTRGNSSLAQLDPAIVSLIYQLRVSGMKQAEIADHLNQLGLRSKRGGKFDQATISRVLAMTTSQKD